MRVFQVISMLLILISVFLLARCQPFILSGNQFLLEFSGSQFIQTIAILVTVSLVNVQQIHLHCTKIEKRFNKRVFQDCRRKINLSATILILMLAVAFSLSFLHPLVLSFPYWLSLVHGGVIIVLLECLFLMYDLVQTATTLAAKEPIQVISSSKSDEQTRSI